ncbi:MAG: hypothetical protein OQL19_18200 [Gammaproteobacteria bacterium]|nr:hypothetical protein [Gammaproteobacteria bacterium]
MKVLVTVSSGDVVQLLVKGADMPLVGKEYSLEKIVDSGTAKQNRTFHPLLECLYTWMLKNDTYQFESNGIQYDFRCSDIDKLKTIFKIRYGKGANRWEYVDDNYNMVEVFDLKEIPTYVVSDFSEGNRGRIKASHAISWKEYDKDDRRKLIDNMINIMKTIGVDSDKFNEILDGIKQ